jgi:hypothetical protein
MSLGRARGSLITRLQQKIQILREPLERWLAFYDIDATRFDERSLINNIITRITNYREYKYEQNMDFEMLLGIPVSGTNEESNKINFTQIMSIYARSVKHTMEILEYPYENHGFEENWDIIYKQIELIISKIIDVKQITESITNISTGDKGIFDMIEELKSYLQDTRSSYDRIINNFINLE